MGKISPRITATLNSIREELEDTWGPDSPDTSDAAASAQAGVGGAVNPSPLGDALDLFLSEIADVAALQYDLDDAAVEKLIFAVADELGIPIPEEEADDGALGLWLGKAKTVQFAQAVLKKAAGE